MQRVFLEGKVCLSANLFRWLVPVAVVPLLMAVPGSAADTELAGVDRFYHQRLDWKLCGTATLDAAGGECAEVIVPLDYGKPHGRTLAVAISRVKATDPARRQGILLSNPGGPGGQGLDSVYLLGDVLSPDVRARYDLIGMDPRGVGRSGRDSRCGWPVGEMIRSAGVDPAGFGRDIVQAAAMATSCLLGDVEQLRQLTTRNTARDMDVILNVLEEKTINYFGLSYGTYLGAVFTQLFPERSGRMVFDSAIDPDRYWEGLVQDWGPADEAALDDWANWVVVKDDWYNIGTTPEQVRATIEALVGAAARQPIVIDGFAIDDHWLPFILHSLLGNARLNEAMAAVVREIANVAGGPPVTARTPRLRAVLEALRVEENSVLAFIACGDVAAPTDPSWYRKNIEDSRATQPVFGPLANNIQPCAFWPRPVEPPTVVRNPVPVLITQATEDPRTPYTHGVRLHQDMSGSRLVTLAGVRIHMTFRPGLSRCVNDAINIYLSEGILPATDTTCYADQVGQ